MEFLYRIKPTRLGMLEDEGTPEEQRLVGEHFAYLQRLTASGVVTMAGRTQTTGPDSFGIITFEADDETAAQAVVDGDPAVAGGVFEAQLFPFRTALRGG